MIQQLIKWRKWADEKPAIGKTFVGKWGDDIYTAHLKYNGKVSSGYRMLCSPSIWCYTSELIPEEKTKYKSVEEFFTKPIKGWVDLEEHTQKIVDLQKEVIDVAIGFGKFILENQINTYMADENSEILFDWNGDLFQSNELFKFYTKQLEAEKLNPDV